MLLHSASPELPYVTPSQPQTGSTTVIDIQPGKGIAIQLFSLQSQFNDVSVPSWFVQLVNPAA